MSSQLLDTPSKHPFSITGFADKIWNGVTETAIRAGWGPAAKLAEAAVLSLMRKIAVGQLTVSSNTDVYVFPSDRSQQGSDLRGEIRVLKDTFWIRLFLMGDLGFAEAYMYGEVECDDLVSLFKMFLLNRDYLANLDSKLSYLFALPQKMTSYRFLNTISNSRSNISAHYDISNDMFAGFLSEDMTYSCAVFADLDGDLVQRTITTPQVPRDQFPPSPPLSDKEPSGITSRAEGSPEPFEATKDLLTFTSSKLDKSLPGHDDLYVAQLRKLDHIISKLKIPSERPVRILEIGSGWGSLSIRIVQQYPLASIDTLTLSVQQQTLAQERIHKEGLDVEKRIQVHLMDYRAMPQEWEGTFDRVVSVEMIEAVGYEFLEGYWKVVDWAMTKEDGAGVVQVITLPEARFDRYIHEIDFIRKWRLVAICRSVATQIFPGGFLPTLTFLLSTLQTGAQGRLVVDSVSNIGPHYARTLREWRIRFLEKFEEVIRPALEKEYSNVMGQGCTDRAKALEEVEVFKRKWIYYYCYCEVGFTTRTLGDHIVAFTREGYQEYGCNVYE